MSNKQLRPAWNDFLGQVEWDHIATLTTRFEYQCAALDAEFQQRFIRRLAQLAQHRINWFSVLEEHVSGYPHMHVLLVGTSDLTIKQLQGAWTAGFTRIKVLPRAAAVRARYRAAIHYVTKRLVTNSDNFDISPRLSRSFSRNMRSD
jgi:hypothetical protein